MASKRRTSGRPVGSRLVIAVLVFAMFFLSFGGLHAQEDDRSDRLFVAMRTPQVLRTSVNRPATIELYVENAAPDDLRILFPPVPNELAITDGPTMRSQGTIGTVVTFSLSSSIPGRYLVPPIRVASNDGRTADLPQLMVRVSTAPGADDAPFQADWRLLRSPVYQEQSVPVIIELNLIDDFVYPELEKVRGPASGLFEEVSGLGDVRLVRIAGVEYYRLPAASFMFTPADSGTVELPSTNVRANEVTVATGPAEIDVLPLPAEVRETGAVGRFEIASEISGTEARPGTTVEVTLEVSGVGNLPVLQVPEPVLEGLTEVRRDESSDFGVDEETLLGYRGERRVRFRYEVQDTGKDARVIIPEFKVFDPASETVRTMPSREFRITVTSASGTTSGPESLELWSADKITAIRWQSWHTAYWLYGLFLLAPVFRGLLALWRVRKRGVVVVALLLPLLVSSSFFAPVDPARIARAIELAEQGEWETAGVLFDLELQENSENAALHRNRAVAALNAGQTSRAVHHIRKAVRLRPDVPELRSDLETIRRVSGSEEGSAIASLMRWEGWFAAALILWTVVWLLGLARPGPGKQIVRFLLLALLVVAGGLTAFSHHTATAPEATVVTDATLFRIPDERAAPWLSLRGGVSVVVELHWNQFYLIRTKNGVEGWIPQTALFYEGDT